MNNSFEIVYTTYEKDGKEMKGMFNPKNSKATSKKQTDSDTPKKKKSTMNYYDDEYDFEYDEEDEDNDDYDSYE
jgi:hypothetical protein